MRIPKIKIINTENIYHILLSFILVFFTIELYKIHLILKDSSYILTKVNPTLENIDNFNKILLQYDLIDKVANYNLIYLGIILAILIFVGSLTYFISVKPLQDELKKHKDDLSKTKEETKTNFESMENKISIFNSEKTKETQETAKKLKEETIDLIAVTAKKINTIEEKSNELIDNVNKELKGLKSKYQQTELDILWTNYNMFEGQKLYESSIAYLYYYITKAVEYNNFTLKDIWFENLLDLLNKISETRDIYGTKLYEDLMNILNKIPGNEDKKELIKKEINRILKK